MPALLKKPTRSGTSSALKFPKEERLELAFFADALREVLGLRPLYMLVAKGDGRRPRRNDEHRFYIPAFSFRLERKPNHRPHQ